MRHLVGTRSVSVTRGREPSLLGMVIVGAIIIIALKIVIGEFREDRTSDDSKKAKVGWLEKDDGMVPVLGRCIWRSSGLESV